MKKLVLVCICCVFCVLPTQPQPPTESLPEFTTREWVIIIR